MIQNTFDLSTSPYNSQVTELYLAYFNRLPDLEGMQYWTKQLQQGATIAMVAEQFFNSAENKNTIAAASSWYSEHSAFIDNAYQISLGRHADWEGKGFWLGLGFRSSQYEFSQRAYQIQQGALAAGGRDAAYVQNRLAFAEYSFAELKRINGLSELNQQFHTSRLQGILGQINEDKASLLDAYANISLKSGAVFAIGDKIRVGTGLDDVLQAETNTEGSQLGLELAGGEGNDLLIGAQGNDLLHGGAGRDTMIGGSGDDVYYVDHIDDVVQESPGGGRDRVITLIDYQLGEQQEELILSGAYALRGKGNALDNYLADVDEKIHGRIGNNQKQTLDGGEGNDTLVSHGGGDQLIGGQGDDQYFVYESDLWHAIPINILEQQNGGHDTIYFMGYSYTAHDFVEDIVVVPRTPSEFKNMHLKGNAQDNRIVGGDYLNFIDGLDGNDILIGGNNIDFLRGGIGNDSLNGGNGNDYLQGEYGDDVLTGGNGDDNLSAYFGRDSLDGGDGNDVLTFCFESKPHNDSDTKGGHILTGGAGHDVFRLGYPSTYNLIAYPTSQIDLTSDVDAPVVDPITIDDDLIIIAPPIVDVPMTPPPDFSPTFGLDAMCRITDFKSGEDKLSFGSLLWSRSNEAQIDFLGNAANFNGSETLLAGKTTAAQNIAAVFDQHSQRLYLDINGDDRIDGHDFFLELVGVAQLSVSDFVTTG